MRYGYLNPLEIDLSENKIGDVGLKILSSYIGYKDLEENKFKFKKEKFKNLKDRLK